MRMFVVSKQVDMERFHICMFHGQTGWTEPYRRDPSSGVGPEFIVRNGTFCPDVTLPKLNLILSGKAAQSLRAFPNLELRPVVFFRLFRMRRYELGEASYEKTRGWKRINSTRGPSSLENLPDDPKLHKSIGEHYELIPPRLIDVQPQFSDLREVEIRWDLHNDIPKKETMLLSSSLFEQYPAIWWHRTILSERAFLRIEPFMEKAYFEIVETSVD